MKVKVETFATVSLAPSFNVLLKFKVYRREKVKVKTFARVSLAPSPDTRGRLATIRPEDHDYIHVDNQADNDNHIHRYAGSK